MTDEAAARATLRLAIVVLVMAALAGVWEVLATQAPGSPLYLGTLPGPVQSLRESALSLGLLMLASAVVWVRLPTESPSATAPRVRLLGLVGLHVGVALSLGAALYGATQGMRVEQLYDLRPEGMLLFALKYTGHVLVALSLGAVGLRALRRGK